MEESKFWYNTKTGQVEEGLKSNSLDRIGPFASRAEASRGLQIVLDKAKALREADEQEFLS
jgi:hypothetical protein